MGDILSIRRTALRMAIVSSLLLATVPVAEAAPRVLATRAVSLSSGDCLQVATRFQDEDYTTGEPIAVDPLLGPCAGDEPQQPAVIFGHIEPRPQGFAPCLATSRAEQDREDCVDGSPPTPLHEGSPAHFSFSFNRLFRRSPSARLDADPSFGYASFDVTLELLTTHGNREVVRFPVTVLVREGITGEQAGPGGPSQPFSAPSSEQPGTSAFDLRD
jgi:hypothetical protein